VFLFSPPKSLHHHIDFLTQYLGEKENTHAISRDSLNNCF
jgi:hypothetical protein